MMEVLFACMAGVLCFACSFPLRGVDRGPYTCFVLLGRYHFAGKL